MGPSDLLATPLSFPLSISRWQNSSRWPWPGFKQDFVILRLVFKCLQHLWMEICRFFHVHVGRREATSLCCCCSWQSKLQSSWTGGGQPPGKPGDALNCPGAGDEKGVKYRQRLKQLGEGSNTGVMGGKGSLLGGVSAWMVGCGVFGVSCCQPRARASIVSLGKGSELARGCRAVALVPH